MSVNQDNSLYGAGNYEAQFVRMGSPADIKVGQILPYSKLQQWNHLVAVGTETTLTLYINGALVCSSNAAAVLNSTGSLIVGGSINPVSGAFNRNIDDIRIYNRSLSTNEVAQLYALESRTLSATRSVGQSLKINLTGQPSSSYVLQTATNLASPVQWKSLITNNADTNGVWQYTETNLNSLRKFYRVSLP